MLYLQSIYLGFLILTILIYYLVKNDYKYIVLFSSSIVFITYLSFKVAIYAVLFSAFNYLWGIQIEKYRSNRKLRLRLFWSAITLDIGFLVFFKYFNMLDTGAKGIISLFADNIQWTTSAILIPLGLSYYTFQALGYIIRINRGSEKAEHDFLKFTTFLIFFPKFFAGPVERSNRFFPQIHNLGSFNKQSVSEGFRLLLWGAFKKYVLAANLYFPVQTVYSDVNSYSGVQLLLVFFVQTIYIYCEFSGYTDMALGSAKLFGITLIDNFNRPFLARNISEFWRRWHISLSSWCNDFIYNPFIVKYRKFGNLSVVTGVFLTFITIGVWHAANWTFVVLGLLQAIAVVYEFYSKKTRLKMASHFPKMVVNTFSRIVVFLFVCVTLTFFFSPTISDAWHLLSHLFKFTAQNIIDNKIVSNKLVFVLAILIFLLILIFEILSENGKNILGMFLKLPVWFKLSVYAILLCAIYFSDKGPVTFEYMKF